MHVIESFFVDAKGISLWMSRLESSSEGPPEDRTGKTPFWTGGSPASSHSRGEAPDPPAPAGCQERASPGQARAAPKGQLGFAETREKPQTLGPRYPTPVSSLKIRRRLEHPGPRNKPQLPSDRQRDEEKGGGGLVAAGPPAGLPEATGGAHIAGAGTGARTQLSASRDWRHPGQSVLRRSGAWGPAGSGNFRLPGAVASNNSPDKWVTVLVRCA
ncbi:Hypothetical predicted protein [Marmota monax]|uniref:Uncharacterized protein n=1 Tax=Marmota monax TaxID=9995 RepID=A0A5E4CTN5_MARMO|nr:Hypothetical predicted protein [Marmota monax]